jgi:hypothetical protein
MVALNFPTCPIPAMPAPYRLDVTCPRHERVVVAAEVRAAVLAAYEAGRYLDAHAVAVAAAPLHQWGGAAARVLAARLAARLGGDRLSAMLAATAWREAPRLAVALLYRAYQIWPERGPLAVWEATAAGPPPTG